jgi:hypothetical protein
VRRHLRLVVTLSIALLTCVVVFLATAAPAWAPTPRDVYACAGGPVGPGPRDWCPPSHQPSPGIP